MRSVRKHESRLTAVGLHEQLVELLHLVGDSLIVVSLALGPFEFGSLVHDPRRPRTNPEPVSNMTHSMDTQQESLEASGIGEVEDGRE